MTLKQKTYHHGDLRSTLIQVSLKLIEEDGLAGLTLRGAAKAAGVSHAAPYAHFRDIEDMFSAIKEEGFKELYMLMASVAGTDLDPIKKFKAFASAYFSFALKHPAKFEIMFHRPLNKDPDAAYTYIETGKKIFALAVAAMRDISPKELTPQEIRQRTVIAWSSIHGICSLWVGNTLKIVVDDQSSFDQISEDVVSSLAWMLGFQRLK